MNSWITIILRSLLGLIFFVLGLEHFFNFFQMPPPASRAAAGFLGALGSTGYMLHLICGVEAIAGALLLSGRFVPLALLILAPVIVNIILFHLFLDPSGLPVAAVVTALEVLLAWQHRQVFAPLLRST